VSLIPQREVLVTVKIVKALFIGMAVLLSVLQAEQKEKQYWEGISAPAEAVMLAARMDGQIKKIHVEESDPVRKDQVLILFDDKVLKLAADRAKKAGEDKSALEAAELRVEYTKIEFERDRKLWLNKNLSESDYAESKTKAALSEADYNRAFFEKELDKLDYELRLAMLDYAKVKSPFDGVVARKFVEAGESAKNLQPLIEVVKIDELKIRLNIPDTMTGILKKGQSSEVKFPVLGSKVFIGRIAMISPVVEPRSGTFAVEVIVENRDLMIKPGLTALVRFIKPSDAKIAPSKSPAKKTKLVGSTEKKVKS